MTRPRLALALLAAQLALAPASARAQLSRETASADLPRATASADLPRATASADLPRETASLHLSREPASLHLSRAPASLHLSRATASLHLAQEPAPPTASERDLAYELGVQAEASGDPARAAAAHERAYRLTPAAETGPRLLFLRASVAARLRADDGGEATRVHLCHAQVLLRDYLADPSLTPALRGAEQTTLEQIDQRLLARASAPACDTLLGLAPPPAPAPTTAPPPAPTAPAPTTTPSTPEGPAPPPAAPLTRPLQIAGGVSLGLGVTGLALLAAGVAVARHANQRGRDHCRAAPTACVANDNVLRDVELAGRRGDTLVRVGAVAASLGIILGVTLLALSTRKPAPRRLQLQPGPGLAVRF